MVNPNAPSPPAAIPIPSPTPPPPNPARPRPSFAGHSRIPSIVLATDGGTPVLATDGGTPVLATDGGTPVQAGRLRSLYLPLPVVSHTNGSKWKGAWQRVEEFAPALHQDAGARLTIGSLVIASTTRAGESANCSNGQKERACTVGDCTGVCCWVLVDPRQAQVRFDKAFKGWRLSRGGIVSDRTPCPNRATSPTSLPKSKAYSSGNEVPIMGGDLTVMHACLWYHAAPLFPHRSDAEHPELGRAWKILNDAAARLSQFTPEEPVPFPEVLAVHDDVVAGATGLLAQYDKGKQYLSAAERVYSAAKAMRITLGPLLFARGEELDGSEAEEEEAHPLQLVQRAVNADLDDF